MLTQFMEDVAAISGERYSDLRTILERSREDVTAISGGCWNDSRSMLQRFQEDVAAISGTCSRNLLGMLMWFKEDVAEVWESTRQRTLVRQCTFGFSVLMTYPYVWHASLICATCLIWFWILYTSRTWPIGTPDEVFLTHLVNLYWSDPRLARSTRAHRNPTSPWHKK